MKALDVTVNIIYSFKLNISFWDSVKMRIIGTVASDRILNVAIDEMRKAMR
jgi:hypothetical protein